MTGLCWGATESRQIGAFSLKSEMASLRLVGANSCASGEVGLGAWEIGGEAVCLVGREGDSLLDICGWLLGSNESKRMVVLGVVLGVLILHRG